MAKKRALNMGLGELLGDINDVYNRAFDGVDNADSKRVATLSVDSIKPNPMQPRLEFDKSALKELADSIKEHGLLQPIIVLSDANSNSGEYILVAGERRLRAVKSLGFSEIECIIIDVEAYKLRELALIENIQRRDLNAIELALCYEALIKEHNLTHERLGERLSKSRVAITNTLRLLELSDNVQNLVIEGRLSQGHARALIGLSKDDEKIAIDSILGQNLSTRDTEKMVSRMKNRTKDSNIESNNIESKNGTKNAKKDSKMIESLQILQEILAENHINATISNNSLILKFDSNSTIQNFITKLQNS